MHVSASYETETIAFQTSAPLPTKWENELGFFLWQFQVHTAPGDWYCRLQDYTRPHTEDTNYLEQFFPERQRNGKATFETQFGDMYLNLLHWEQGTAVFLVRIVTGQKVF